MMARPTEADGGSKAPSRVFLGVRVMRSRSGSLDLLATKVELLLRAILRPCLVEPIDGILWLDPESLQGEDDCPYRDDRRRPWSHVPTVEAPHPRALDSARDDDVLDHHLEPVP